MSESIDDKLRQAHEPFRRNHDRLRNELMASLPERTPEPIRVGWVGRGWQWIGETTMRRRLLGTSAVAASLALAATGIWVFLLAAPAPSAAAALDSAWQALTTAETLFVRRSFHSVIGGSTESRTWVDRNRGYRSEDETSVTIGNLQDGMLYEWRRDRNEVLETEWADAARADEWLERADLDFWLPSLRKRAEKSETELTMEPVDNDGPAVWRISFADPQSNPAVVTVDVDAEGRVVRTDVQWSDSMRNVTNYEYPTADQMDSSLFAAPDAAIPRVLDERRARQMCMSNIKWIGRELHVYAANAEGRFPTALADLPGLNESRRPMPTCPKDDGSESVAYRYHRPVQYPEPNDVLVECLNHGDQRVVVFGDSHSEVIPKADQ